MPRRIPSYRPPGSTLPTLRPRRVEPVADHDRIGLHSRRWRKVRLGKLRADPLCEDCLAEGRTTPATEAHHQVKRADDPTGEHWFDEERLRSLCKSHHSQRTARGE